MLAEGQPISLLGGDPLPGDGGKTELVHKPQSSQSRHDLGLRPSLGHRPQPGPVVRLQMVEDDVVQPPAIQQVLHILHQLGGRRPVHTVKKDGLLVQQQVGIVAHPPGDGVDVLKQGGPPVIGPHPPKVRGDLSHIVHGKILLCMIFALAFAF